MSERSRSVPALLRACINVAATWREVAGVGCQRAVTVVKFEHVPTTLSPIVLALVAAVPWWIAPALVSLRLRTTPSLDDIDATPPKVQDAERVSVILPARNEASHIGACVRSVLSSTWPNLELIVVDDHSSDGTSNLARDAAGGDVRMTLVSAPDLAAGWFGKQWACQSGAAHATGSLLLFIDADTRHSPDLVGRLVRARAERGAELMSVAGRQEMLTLWERAVQPCVFVLILLRYGGADSMERASNASDVVANGQCFMLSRAVYDAIGGHNAVRDFVAEDVMMAQTVWKSGKRVSLVRGLNQLSTRMYNGLGELVKGWGKNVYAGGRFAMRGGAVGRAIYPLLLLSFPLGMVCPFALLLTLAIANVALGSTPLSVDAPVGDALFGTTLLWWSAATSLGVLATFGVANKLNRDPVWRALLAPLGGAVLLYICIVAIARGRNVSWKGRGYQAR